MPAPITSPHITALRQNLETTIEHVEQLRQLIADLEPKLAEAQSRAPVDAFAKFVAGPDVEGEPSAASLTAEHAELLEALKGGEARIESLEGQILDATRAEVRRIEAGMTVADAVLFAREALAEIDIDARQRRATKAEERITRLDAEQVAAWARYARARDIRDDHSMRYRGQPTPPAVARFEELAGAADAAHAEFIRVRESAASARRSIRREQDEAADLAKHACRHITRLVEAQAESVAKVGTNLVTFARTIGTRQMMVTPPSPIELELPSAADMAELNKMVAAAVSFSRRPIAEQRHMSQLVAA
ncbi:hypothetical protein ACT009_11575 [Sphingomonas sp. Tas61C01]|uniref:hypothetical protein n=1 Tax=Sphingomonas sp. Tas61C01 TaxID=3458297 RepID=UPI00403EA760